MGVAIGSQSTCPQAGALCPTIFTMKRLAAKVGPTRLLDQQRRVLNTWIARERDGDQAWKDKVDKITSVKEKSAFLEHNVIPDPPRTFTWHISDYSQARAIECGYPGPKSVVFKTYASHSKALKRTLCIYGYL